MIHVHEQRYDYLEEINVDLVRRIPFNRTSQEMSVLDVGCGSGALSGAIAEKGYTVWGIEANKEAAAKAALRISGVLETDLTFFQAVKEQLGSRLFDYIVFSEVLEHVYDPFTVLKQYSAFLKPGGFVLVAVPNALVWANRLKFLFGRFEYTDTGVMDRTHIRFFTFRTAKRLVKAAGFSITGVDYSPYFIRAALPLIKKIYVKDREWEKSDRRQILDSVAYRRYMRFIYPVERFLGYWFKSFSGFRIIITGRKV